jgi:deoxyribonuclease-1
MHFIIVLYAALLTLPSYAKEFNSFYQAKRYLTKTITKNQRTLYCGCKIIQTGKKLRPDARSCGYVPRRPVTHAGKINSRTTRIEWEHIVSGSLVINYNAGNMAAEKTAEKPAHYLGKWKRTYVTLHRQ